MSEQHNLFEGSVLSGDQIRERMRLRYQNTHILLMKMRNIRRIMGLSFVVAFTFLTISFSGWLQGNNSLQQFIKVFFITGFVLLFLAGSASLALLAHVTYDALDALYDEDFWKTVDETVKEKIHRAYY